ncbi:MAG: pilus assembly protein TadE [Novosphingobium sp.]|nr:pilus assembly protein TadE [Novosphingobium sp.]
MKLSRPKNSLARVGRRLIKRLRPDSAGNAAIEMAIALPVLITMGMYGTEIAYMASVNMQVSQIATSLADNSSRLGQTDNSSITPTVTETDIDSIMGGTLRQGSDIRLSENGRVILTSLERDEDSGRQYIHWQRCAGDFDKDSSYGDDGSNNGLSGEEILGLGRPGSLITAPAGASVMYAEIFFQYQPLFGDIFVGNVNFKKEAAFLVRDDRNLTPGVTGSGGTSACS